MDYTSLSLITDKIHNQPKCSIRLSSFLHSNAKTEQFQPFYLVENGISDKSTLIPYQLTDHHFTSISTNYGFYLHSFSQAIIFLCPISVSENPKAKTILFSSQVSLSIESIPCIQFTFSISTSHPSLSSPFFLFKVSSSQIVASKSATANVLRARGIHTSNLF